MQLQPTRTTHIELPIDRTAEQPVVDAIARELNGGELPVPREFAQQVAGVLVLGRRAYRLGRSDIDNIDEDEFNSVLFNVAEGPQNTMNRSGYSVLNDPRKRTLIVGAFTAGRAVRDELEAQSPQKQEIVSQEFVLHGHPKTVDVTAEVNHG